MTRLVLISDSHLRHDFSVPEGNVLIHGGDLSMSGAVWEVQRALDWLQSLGFEHTVFVAGNHDKVTQDMPGLTRIMARDRGLTWLQDSGVEIEGIKIWGSAWTPTFFNWFWMAERGPEIAAKWAIIPDDTQLLITHGPPRGHGDFSSYGNVNVGCEDLLARVENLEALKLHAYGHIHGSYGWEQEAGYQGPIFVNASTVDENYIPAHKPIVIETDPIWQVVYD
jgi:Icc-related predicted phosphoesterase